MKELRRNTLIGISIILLIIVAIVVISILSGHDAEKKNSKPTPTTSAQISPVPTAELKGSVVMRGIVEGMDRDSSELGILDISSGEKVNLHFTGITEARDSYGSLVTPMHFKIGDIVEVKYMTDTDETEYIKSYSGAWEYKNVRNLRFDETIGKMTIGDAIYRFDSKLVIISNQGFTKLSELDKLDVLHVRGIDNRICVLIVAKGHGYLALDDASGFVGGTIEIGSGKTETITEDMKLKLREGEYEVRIVNGEYSGTKIMKVSRNETAVFPASEFGPKPVPKGRITFRINPEGAELYVDGVKSLYDEAVELTYGNHEIEVALGGYTTYRGSVYVERTDDIVNITLVENDPQDEDEWPVIDKSPEDEDSYTDDYDDRTDDEDGRTDYEDDWTDEDDEWTDDEDDWTDVEDDWTDEEDDRVDDEDDWTDENMPTPSPIASNNRMIIICSEGTSVFVNGTYMGDIEDGQLTIPKQYGSIVLTLEKEGCISKVYTVFVEEGSEDAVFNFPDMVSEE